MTPPTPDAIDPEVLTWFGDQIQSIALEHDLAGPHIARVPKAKYKRRLIAKLRQLALAAGATREVMIPLQHLDELCALAADELIRIREIRDAHASGTLSTTAMRQLPCYPDYPDYFDEDPSLVLGGLFTAVAKMPNGPSASETKSAEHDRPRRSGSQLGSPHVHAWAKTQVLGLALAEDLCGPRPAASAEEPYAAKSNARLRQHALQAIELGDLPLDPDDIDALCRHVAAEAFLIRSLKAAHASGTLPDHDLRQSPAYHAHRDYFDTGAELGALAMTLDALGVRSCKPSGLTN